MTGRSANVGADRAGPAEPGGAGAVCYSFGEGLEGGHFYDGHPIASFMHSQSLLAYEMNFEPLSEQHGTPLRLRVENQLGFKMVKWIRAITTRETGISANWPTFEIETRLVAQHHCTVALQSFMTLGGRNS